MGEVTVATSNGRLPKFLSNRDCWTINAEAGLGCSNDGRKGLKGAV
jgi:hypothetical protein